jgi:hypothetical protein
MCVLPEACVYDLDDDYLASRRSIAWDQLPITLDSAACAAIDALPPGALTNSEMRTVLFEPKGQRPQRMPCDGNESLAASALSSQQRRACDGAPGCT